MNPHLNPIKHSALPLDISTKEGIDIFLVRLRQQFIIRKAKLNTLVREADYYIHSALSYLKSTTHPSSHFLIELKRPWALKIHWSDGFNSGYEATLDLTPTFDEWLDEEFEKAEKKVQQHIEKLYQFYQSK